LSLVSFTPGSALLGGLLIGVATSMLWLINGRIAGISGIVGGLLQPTPGDVGWRMAFVAGLGLGGLSLATWYPEAFASAVVRPWWVVAVAGLLVGFGTRMGSGCTSGHGVCGLSRFSPRSLVATLTFIATGALTVALTRLWLD
jgi:uncharacterized membrane protein YedE/YeeE